MILTKAFTIIEYFQKTKSIYKSSTFKRPNQFIMQPLLAGRVDLIIIYFCYKSSTMHYV